LGSDWPSKVAAKAQKTAMKPRTAGLLLAL
jgi:hypothetical protein